MGLPVSLPQGPGTPPYDGEPCGVSRERTAPARRSGRPQTPPAAYAAIHASPRGVLHVRPRREGRPPATRRRSAGSDGSSVYATEGVAVCAWLSLALLVDSRGRGRKMFLNPPARRRAVLFRILHSCRGTRRRHCHSSMQQPFPKKRARLPSSKGGSCADAAWIQLSPICTVSGGPNGGRMYQDSVCSPDVWLIRMTVGSTRNASYSCLYISGSYEIRIVSKRERTLPRAATFTLTQALVYAQ